MKKLLPWIVATVALAALLHIISMWYLPQFLTARAVQRIYARRQTGVPVNTMTHGVLRVAGTDTVVRDNPDTVTSLAVYDLSARPLRVKCVIPPQDNYWSVSFFDWNTDNYRVINDRTAKAKEFEVVLVKPNSQYQQRGNEEVIVAPSARGIALIRMIVTDRNNKEELAKLSEAQKQSFVELVADGAY
ncbi:MAG: DUF1254 domain-containing protein [Blastocatellia bacterium]